MQERGIGSRHDQRFVPLLALPAGEEENLALPAAPIAAAVEVEDSKKHAPERWRRVGREGNA
jgi:hypothetical protein